MKNLQKLYGIMAVLMIVFSIIGCDLMNDADQPTSPANSSPGLTPAGAGQLANFYVSSGVTDFYGVYIAGTSLVINIPDPGTYLITYYTRGGYGISDYTVDKLREKGVPEDVLANLSPLVEQEFATEAEFLAELKKQIGAEAFDAYRSLILRYSGIRSGGPFFLVAQVERNSLLYIGLMPGDQVLDVYISEGDATELATTTPDAQHFGSVVVLFRPGFVGSWTDYFIVNPSIPQITLISNGAIVVNINVIILELPEGITRKTQHFTKPKSKK